MENCVARYGPGASPDSWMKRESVIVRSWREAIILPGCIMMEEVNA